MLILAGNNFNHHSYVMMRKKTRNSFRNYFAFKKTTYFNCFKTAIKWKHGIVNIFNNFQHINNCNSIQYGKK